MMILPYKAPEISPAIKNTRPLSRKLIFFQVFNGYRYSAKDGLQSMWAEMLFIVFIVYFSFREVSRMLKQGRLAANTI